MGLTNAATRVRLAGRVALDVRRHFDVDRSGLDFVRKLWDTANEFSSGRLKDGERWHLGNVPALGGREARRARDRAPTESVFTVEDLDVANGEVVTRIEAVQDEPRGHVQVSSMRSLRKKWKLYMLRSVLK